MDKKAFDFVCQAVYDQFPLLKGIIPEIKPQPNGNQVLIFQSSQKLTEQKAIPIQVRVLIDAYGKIKKISTAR